MGLTGTDVATKTLSSITTSDAREDKRRDLQKKKDRTVQHHKKVKGHIKRSRLLLMRSYSCELDWITLRKYNDVRTAIE